jgi:hypothetical protein
MCRWPENFFHGYGTQFIQLEEHHTSNGSSCREQVNLAALNQNLLAASNHHNDNPKPKGGSKFQNRRKVGPTNSSSNGRPIVCFGCNNPGHKKSECPEKKEENMANDGAARGRPMAMAPKKFIMQAWHNL